MSNCERDEIPQLDVVTAHERGGHGVEDRGDDRLDHREVARVLYQPETVVSSCSRTSGIAARASGSANSTGSHSSPSRISSGISMAFPIPPIKDIMGVLGVRASAMETTRVRPKVLATQASQPTLTRMFYILSAPARNGRFLKEWR